MADRPPPRGTDGDQQPESGQQASFGGYGPQGSGYGSQSSYASHGGYGHESQTGAGGPGGGGQHAGSQQPRTKDDPSSDDRIREDIRDYLMQSIHIDSSKVTIEVRDGKVTLGGTVPDLSMKHEIEAIAAGYRGVKEVDDRVQLSTSGPVAES